MPVKRILKGEKIMEKWARANYQPCLPLGDNNSRITGCEKHRMLSRRAATEGTVLLKNNRSLLPLRKDKKLAVFGKAQFDYVKGGGGSGDVTVEYVKNIYDGLKEKNADVLEELSMYYKTYVDGEFKKGAEIGRLEECELPAELIEKAKAFTDTAIITISRFSGEGWDRKNDGEDVYFYLSDAEKKMVDKVCAGFANVIVLLNVGAMTDTSWFANNDKVDAAVLIWQGGMEGGGAAADVLFGDANPSGKLVDTCAAAFEDYPSSEGFHESKDYVKYTEDIFVGYRYFETIPGAAERVVYPFGYGLSYTSFDLSDISVCDNGERIFVSLSVKNTGKRAGKEVVQVYYSAPRGKLSKPAKELCAFAKTRELNPGEAQTLIMSFAIKDMASYDDTGAVCKSAYVMEKGTYNIYVGTSVRAEKFGDYEYVLENDRVVEQLTEYCVPENLGKRMLEDGNYAAVADTNPVRKTFECDYTPAEKPSEEYKLIDVANGKITLEEFIAQLDNEDLLILAGGQPNTGIANTFGIGNIPKYGIPSIMTADGPAGVRINKACGVNTTAFPVATMLACTWNTELVSEIGRAGALEMKENNLGVWLTPALNIHRSPLCGRNFEYYSEDPFVAGKMAAAMVNGIQSQNIAATPKHFACNNKETNREHSNSIVSERALREIYLKGFEICVKESSPKVLMTSYNIINNVRSAENAELITGILRGECNFMGMITSDWWVRDKQSLEIKAGNDFHMNFASINEMRTALDEGTLTRNELCACAKRVLEMILWIE